MESHRLHALLNRRTFVIGAGGLATVLVARIGSAQDVVGTPGDAAAEATVTRAAEQTEIAALRTQVAEMPKCDTPTPTVEATATATVVPPVPAGTPVVLNDTFLVTVLGIAPAVAPEGIQIQGALMQLNFTAENTTAAAAKLPYFDFTLTTEAGTTSQFNSKLNTDIVGSDIAFAIRPGVVANLSMVFDFPDAAATSFILINSDDPAFRVAVDVVERG